MTEAVAHGRRPIGKPRAARANGVFRTDPGDPRRRLWRASPWPARLTAVAGAMAGVLTLMMAAGTVLLARLVQDRFDALPVAILAAAAFALAVTTAYLWRQRHALRGNAIALGEGSVTLRLANAHGLLPRSATIRMGVPHAEIAALECRIEYGVLQAKRVYRLRRRDGTRLFLFEDRAVGTFLETPSLRPVAAAIAAHAGVPLVEEPAGGSIPAPAGPPGWFRRNAEPASLAFGLVAMAVVMLLWVDLLARMLKV